MPANLTPDYLAAEERSREAETTEEKIEALQEMLAVIPKHKGTEKLQADLKRRLAKLRQEIQQKKKIPGHRTHSLLIQKEGAGQVILLGFPNVGKSALIGAMTNAKPHVSDYPFTTQKPIPGMMIYQNVQIQLIDTPAVTTDFMEPWLPDLVRHADIAVLVIDLTADNMLEQLDVVIERLYKGRICLIEGLSANNQDELAMINRTTLLVANKGDIEDAQEQYEILKELYHGRFSPLLVSAKTGMGLKELSKSIYYSLDIIRVYPKPPGHKPDLDQPFILRSGSTVFDLATTVHKDFAEKLKFARVWGATKFPGQTVNRGHVLNDGDIVELHI